MALELLTIPCLSDNYAFVIGNPQTGEAALIDAPEAAPINAALRASGWTLTTVLLTHHHWDHVEGLDGIDRLPDLRILGAAADAQRLPALDQPLGEGDHISICGEAAHVLDVPGHTVGHIALHLPESGLLFTGDSLMAMGCGRLFEGTPEMMWASLQKLRALPSATRVCSGHEYTETNIAFAQSITPDHQPLAARARSVAQKRAENRPSVPSLLGDEAATNPFLRADGPAMARALGMENEPPAAIFARLRQMRDTW